MQNEKVPEWAIDEALKRCGVNPDQKPFSDWRDATYARAVRLFAAHIAEHEDPPVDPLLDEARKIAGDVMASHCSSGQIYSSGSINSVRTGNEDGSVFVQAALAALKRGIELARKEDSHAG